ncbi:MAG TPA: phosphatidylglycerol lysyltransferase domain-containing protein [Gaiellaceae bacterium]|nr:phosphatidylglycerol lysyltransferase domain-containing protein [Gaiellaceae bacterium]
MHRVVRSAAASTAAVAVLLAATGWLYVVRPELSLPGPTVHDALALDELSKHGSVSVLVYLAVWGAAAALLAMLARWSRLERLTAGLLLGVGVGSWLYAVNGVSILVVRQIPAHQAFHAAASEQAVAIAAVLAGIAGALAGRTRTSPAPRSRAVLGWLISGVGTLAALDAMFPEHRRSLVTSLDAAHVHGVSKALVVPLAVALVVTARSVARGSRRAWELALALLALLLALNVERRFGDGAIVTGVAVVALLARRADFRLRGDPSSKPRVLLHAAALAGAIGVYGVATLWVNRLMIDQPYTLTFALRTTGRALAGLSFHGAHHLAGPVADWFPVSVFLLGVVGLLAILLEWLAPWRYRLLRGAHELDLVRRLVATFGADTLAPFALRSDKSYFFSEDESAFLAYRVVGGVALVSGDPIGRPVARRALIRLFLDFAHERGWRVAVLGVSEGDLELYRSLGLRALYHGDEAVVETATFSLTGRPIRKVRQSVSRLEKAGFTARVLRPGEVDARLRLELDEIAREWRGTEPERGFVMALDALFRAGDDEAVFVVGFDRGGRARGFLHFGLCPAGSAISLSSMPRAADVPNGFTEWLICASIAWARASGYARVSLNFSPFAALLSPEGELGVGQRLQAATLRRVKGWFQLDNLLVFNRKFFPSWQRRFVVYERRRDLPRVGVAALAVEAYLPFQ